MSKLNTAEITTTATLPGEGTAEVQSKRRGRPRKEASAETATKRRGRPAGSKNKTKADTKTAKSSKANKAPQSASKNVCSKCGATHSAKALFCSQCAHMVASVGAITLANLNHLRDTGENQLTDDMINYAIKAVKSLLKG